MKKTRYTEEQIAFALRQAESGTALGTSEQTFYSWKKQYTGLGVGDIRRLKQLVTDLAPPGLCRQFTAQLGRGRPLKPGNSLRVWARGVVNGPFVHALLGPEWRGVIPLLRILSFVGALQSLGNPVGWIYMSQGRTDWMFRWGMAENTCIIGAIVLGAYVGTVEGIAYAYLIINVILIAPGIDIPGRLIGLRAFEVGKAVSGIILCSVLMAGGVRAIGQLLPPTLRSWQTLAIEVIAGVALYGGSSVLFRLRVLSDLPIILPGRLRRSLMP